VLKHASRSRHIDPDRPPAAAGGLRSHVPDLVHGPRELLDCRQLQQAGRRERTRAPSTVGRRRASTWQLQLSHRAVRASTDEQRTGYALGVAIVPTLLSGWSYEARYVESGELKRRRASAACENVESSGKRERHNNDVSNPWSNRRC